MLDSLKFQCRTRLFGWCNVVSYPTGCFRSSVSMPHAAFWVVQRRLLRHPARPHFCFNAARGFVGGATFVLTEVEYDALTFQCRTRLFPFAPHHRFAVPLPRSRRGGLVRLRFLAESRNISFPRRCGGAVNVCQSHFVLLVFLGRFPIRPVSRSAVPYGLASRTGQ